MLSAKKVPKFVSLILQIRFILMFLKKLRSRVDFIFKYLKEKSIFILKIKLILFNNLTNKQLSILNDKAFYLDENLFSKKH